MSQTFSPAEAARLAAGDGWPLDDEQARYLAGYAGLTETWNKKMNLVGPSSAAEILRQLAADSWHLARFLDSLSLPSDPLSLDFGAGAGLPGLPLRAFWTRGNYHLVEARAKRASFLRYATARLKPANTHVHQSRVENLPQDLRGADLIVSRAFMPWRDFLGISLDFLSPGGICLVMANEPEPVGAGDCVEAGAGPTQWRLVAGTRYTVLDAVRYFWAFTPVSISK